MKTNAPTHEEIARHAREIWLAQGEPAGRDEEIWLEAERELAKPVEAHNAPSTTAGRGNGNTQASRSNADPKPAELKRPVAPQAGGPAKAGSPETTRLREEMASESEVEYQITPAVSDDEAIKAALQKRDARAPQVPTKTVPHTLPPPESGKPLWDRPHSS